MTRFVEDIVESHRIARDRIAQGRPVWDRMIKIKSVIFRDQANTTEAHAAAVANEIAAIIRASVPASWLELDDDQYDEDLLEIVENMESLRPDSYADDPAFTVLEDLNDALESLYDWADSKRVWLG